MGGGAEESPRVEGGKQGGETSSIRLWKQIADTQPVTEKRVMDIAEQQGGMREMAFWVSRWGIGVFGFGLFCFCLLTWLGCSLRRIRAVCCVFLVRTRKYKVCLG